MWAEDWHSTSIVNFKPFQLVVSKSNLYHHRSKEWLRKLRPIYFDRCASVAPHIPSQVTSSNIWLSQDIKTITTVTVTHQPYSVTKTNHFIRPSFNSWINWKCYNADADEQCPCEYFSKLCGFFSRESNSEISVRSFQRLQR